MSSAPENEADFERFRQQLPELAGDAMLLCDAEGVIRFWNKSAERVFGFGQEEALGRSLDIIIPQNQRDRHWAGYRRAVARGVSRYGDGELLATPALRKDGARISIEFTVALFRDGDGRVAGVAAIVRDVSATFEKIRSLRQRLAEAEA